VFVEFESVRDADRIGVWYSLLKRYPAHNVYRMKLPRNTSTSLCEAEISGYPSLCFTIQYSLM
ncbi:hypothetical protein GOODEAATRI_003508, partial [Goodea atripinnis]